MLADRPGREPTGLFSGNLEVCGSLCLSFEHYHSEISATFAISVDEYLNRKIVCSYNINLEFKQSLEKDVWISIFVGNEYNRSLNSKCLLK